MTPLVSVVMSVYNGELFLGDALRSILRQTFKDFELIVIDDGSTDGTPSILSEFHDPRIHVITNEHNIGLTRSLNRGLKIARGEFIARHDADDISHPERFQRQVSYLMDHGNLSLLGTGYHIIDWKGQILHTISPPESNIDLQKCLNQHNCFCHGTVMIRRKVLDMVGGYCEQFPVTQDYDLWLRLAECSDIGNLASPLYYFRFNKETVSQKKRGQQIAYELLARDLARQRRTFGAEGEYPVDVIKTFPPKLFQFINHARWVAYLYYLSGQFDHASNEIHRANKLLVHSNDELDNWNDWAWKRARQIAIDRNCVQAGADFISWFYNVISLGNERGSRKTLARFYADQAFLAYQGGYWKQVIANTSCAVSNDITWLSNRGLWAISWRSFWRDFGDRSKFCVNKHLV